MSRRGESSPAAPYEQTFRDALPSVIPWLRRLLRRWGIAGRHVDDRIQDTLVQCWRGIRDDAFNPGEAPIDATLRAWIAVIARNRVVDHARWTSRHPEHPPLVGLGEDGDEELDAVDPRTTREEDRIAARDILARIEQLDPRLQATLVLLAEGRTIKGQNAHRPVRRAREALTATLDRGARKAVWQKAPTMLIRRQRPRKAKSEDDGLDCELWPMGGAFG